MKVASIIFTILSFLAIPLIIVLAFLTEGAADTDAMIGTMILAGIAFFVFGYFAHIFIHNYRATYGYDRGVKFLFIVTYPAFIIPYVVIFILYLLFRFVDYLCYLFFDKYYLSEFLNWAKKYLLTSGSGYKGDSSGEQRGQDVYVILDEHNFERKLVEIEHYKCDMQLDGQPHYNRFKDDTGAYWRSYDNNQTFISEAELLRQRGVLL